MTIGQNIKKLRKERGITQAKLAKKIGVYQSTITWWEHDDRMPTIFNAICLADVFGITLDELVGRTVAK